MTLKTAPRQFLLAAVCNALPQVQGGKLYALAMASRERNPAYPDVPTIAESGYPGFSAVSWFGRSAPTGTPKDVIQRLGDAARQSQSGARQPKPPAPNWTEP